LDLRLAARLEREEEQRLLRPRFLLAQPHRDDSVGVKLWRERPEVEEGPTDLHRRAWPKSGENMPQEQGVGGAGLGGSQGGPGRGITPVALASYKLGLRLMQAEMLHFHARRKTRVGGASLVKGTFTLLAAAFEVFAATVPLSEESRSGGHALIREAAEAWESAARQGHHDTVPAHVGDCLGLLRAYLEDIAELLARTPGAQDWYRLGLSSATVENQQTRANHPPCWSWWDEAVVVELLDRTGSSLDEVFPGGLAAAAAVVEPGDRAVGGWSIEPDVFDGWPYLEVGLENLARRARGGAPQRSPQGPIAEARTPPEGANVSAPAASSPPPPPPVLARQIGDEACANIEEHVVRPSPFPPHAEQRLAPPAQTGEVESDAAEDHPEIETPTGESGSTRSGWCHPPGEPAPPDYKYGPLSGTQAKLAEAVRPSPGKKPDRRRLQSMAERGFIWVRGGGQYYEVFFRDQRTYAEANSRLLRI
jgi:hypothetical protein